MAVGLSLLSGLLFLTDEISSASPRAQGIDLARSSIATVRAAAAAEPDSVLEPGHPIEHILAGGEALSFQLDLDGAQLLQVMVDQRGIDLVVALYGPEGEKTAEVDSPNATFGPESIVLVTRTAGMYRLEVRSPDSQARAGSFEAKIVEMRPARPQDESRVAAQDAFTEARFLRDRRTAESQRAALEKYEAAVSLWRSVGDRLQEAHSLHAMGMVYGDVGEYQKALDAYRQALAHYRDLHDPRGQASVLNNLGWTLSTLGEHQTAIDYYEKAQEAARAAGDPSDNPRYLNNIAAAYASLGEYRRALEIHQQVLALRRTANDRGGQAITLNNIASCYESLGDKPMALRYYGLALELMPELGSAFYTAATLNHLGALSRELGEPQKALGYLDRALLLRRGIGDTTGEAATLYEIARLERDRGYLDTARGHIEGALAAVESLRAKLASQQLRASFFATARQYQEFYVDLLMRLHRERPAAGFDALALKASERARARSLLELLSEARAGIRHGADLALLERESALRQTISARADRRMRLLSGAHTDEQAAAAAEEINALTSEYEQVQALIRQTSPRYAALREPVPLTLDEIQSGLLDEQTLLLEYGLGGEKSYLWAVTSTSIVSFELPEREEIEAAVRRFYDAVTARSHPAPGETPEQRYQRRERADTEAPAAAEALSRMLLGPVSALLGNQRLLIVAEGVLQLVPFAALPVPRAGDPTPLIVDHEIVTLPSASVLAVLRREASGRRPPDKTLLVFADPVFSADDPRVALAAASRGATIGGASAEEVQRSVAESGLPALVRLRFSRLEADEIGRFADEESKLLALDFEASRALATSEELAHYRLVHFATHGLIDDRHPELSGIVLSLLDPQGRPQNGFLRLYDIYDLEMRADLVVLSACQTALGKEVTGEGLIGLTRGFMYAGTPRVVATLWSIDDRATAELMRRFYDGVLQQGLRPAAALRAAQVSMWQERRWQAPYYWAAFTFQGEWR